jgi:phosphoribosylglycinamide formyltransferase 1
MNVGVLVSGNGTNLQALLDAEARGELAPARIACVVSNRPAVAALARAARAGKPHAVVDHKGFGDRAGFEQQLLAELAAHEVEAVVLAGFMRVLTATFIDGLSAPPFGGAARSGSAGAFPFRIINTHPSLLPAFPGVDAPAQAVAYGVKLSGVTVHFVDTSLDGGPIIAQVAVPVGAGDDAAALHARIQREEHALLPRVVQRLAAGRYSCEGRRVVERAE